jgi:hypothetical protein
MGPWTGWTAIGCFLAVLEAGSFVGAAERLGTSSGQASKLVSRLEAELGVRLLNRTTRAVAPTEAGQAYYDRLRPLIDEFDNLDLELPVKSLHHSLQRPRLGKPVADVVKDIASSDRDVEQRANSIGCCGGSSSDQQHSRPTKQGAVAREQVERRPDGQWCDSQLCRPSAAGDGQLRRHIPAPTHLSFLHNTTILLTASPAGDWAARRELAFPSPLQFCLSAAPQPIAIRRTTPRHDEQAASRSADRRWCRPPSRNSAALLPVRCRRR